MTETTRRLGALEEVFVMLRLDVRLVSALASIGIAVATATACSAPEEKPVTNEAAGDDDDDDDELNAKPTTKPQTPTSDAGAPPPAPTTTAPPPLPTAPDAGVPAPSCGAQTTHDTCMACCIGPNEQAWSIGKQAFNLCALQHCGDECSQGAHHPLCQACLGVCSQFADNHCAQNPTCGPILQCVQASACDAKP